MLRPVRVGHANLPRVSDTLTYVIEFAVGTASFGAGIAVWRANAPRWLATVLCVAGIAACVHAAAELIG
jgi:hypothetical protein